MGSEDMATSEKITRPIKTTTNLLDQVAAVMNLAGDPPVTFFSDVTWDLGSLLSHAYWHYMHHRGRIVNSAGEQGGPPFLGQVCAGSVAIWRRYNVFANAHCRLSPSDRLIHFRPLQERPSRIWCDRRRRSVPSVARHTSQGDETWTGVCGFEFAVERSPILRISEPPAPIGFHSRW
jgi:hypothetical protein